MATAIQFEKLMSGAQGSSTSIERHDSAAETHCEDERTLREPSQAITAQTFYSISELAKRWRCSRASVYNRLRGEKVLDFARQGHKGQKLVPAETVLRIEQGRMRVFR
jgi:hypothetical protein